MFKYDSFLCFLNQLVPKFQTTLVLCRIMSPFLFFDFPQVILCSDHIPAVFSSLTVKFPTLSAQSRWSLSSFTYWNLISLSRISLISSKQFLTRRTSPRLFLRKMWVVLSNYLVFAVLRGRGMHSEEKKVEELRGKKCMVFICKFCYSFRRINYERKIVWLRSTTRIKRIA